MKRLLLIWLFFALPVRAGEPVPLDAVMRAPASRQAAADMRLIDACLDGDRAAAEAALADGARLEARHGPNGLTPLMLVIYRDHGALLELLLQHGALIDARNLEQQTPLIMAAAGGQTDVVTRLLAAGARLDDRDSVGNSALMWAAFWGHGDTLAALLAAGADPGLHNNERDTALLLAARSEVSQQTRQLLSRQREHAPNGRRLPLLLRDDESAAMVAALIAAGADADIRNARGQTAMMLLAELGRSRSLDVLLKAGADKRLRDQDGRSAADYARQAGFAELARRLAP